MFIPAALAPALPMMSPSAFSFENVYTPLHVQVRVFESVYIAASLVSPCKPCHQPKHHGGKLPRLHEPNQQGMTPHPGGRRTTGMQPHHGRRCQVRFNQDRRFDRIRQHRRPHGCSKSSWQPQWPTTRIPHVRGPTERQKGGVRSRSQ